MMSDDLLMPLATWPAWFHVGKYTPATQRDRVARGLHPMGLRLASPGTGTCGTCIHLSAAPYHDGKYFKCKLTKWTHGFGTDIRRKWPACERYESHP